MIKKIIIVLVIISILIGLYKITAKSPTANTSNGVDTNSADIIIYWGEGCPHCENVKKYVAVNGIDSKLKINWKEVYKDKKNQAEMSQIVKKCPEIDTSKGMGVPLGFSTKEQKCFIGDEPIINWMSAHVSTK